MQIYYLSYLIYWVIPHSVFWGIERLVRGVIAGEKVVRTSRRFAILILTLGDFYLTSIGDSYFDF